MTVIKTKALRDRRPKSTPTVLETTGGSKITFKNPFKMALETSEQLLDQMEKATSISDIRAIFVDLANGGKADWDTYISDDEPTLEDLQEVFQGIIEAFQSVSGTPGESKA